MEFEDEAYPFFRSSFFDAPFGNAALAISNVIKSMRDWTTNGDSGRVSNCEREFFTHAENLQGAIRSLDAIISKLHSFTGKISPAEGALATALQHIIDQIRPRPNYIYDDINATGYVSPASAETSVAADGDSHPAPAVPLARPVGFIPQRNSTYPQVSLELSAHGVTIAVAALIDSGCAVDLVLTKQIQEKLKIQKVKVCFYHLLF